MSEQDVAGVSRGLAPLTIRVVYEAGWSGATWGATATGDRLASGTLEATGAAGVPDHADGGREPGSPVWADLPAEAGEVIDRDDGAAGAAIELVPSVKPPSRDDRCAPLAAKRIRTGPMAALTTACLLLPAGLWQFAGVPGACWLSAPNYNETVAELAADVVARRIVKVESNGDANAKNPRSTATGAGQFLDGTWLDMIRAYRPDLGGRDEAEILDLRYDPHVSREMVARFAEENADMLGRRCLPVTPGTLYLSHFAGGAGAVAVLSAPDTADAAATMAEADSTGRTTREMIVTANPFLADFTVADLKRWADRKMGVSGEWQL